MRYITALLLISTLAFGQRMTLLKPVQSGGKTYHITLDRIESTGRIVAISASDSILLAVIKAFFVKANYANHFLPPEFTAGNKFNSFSDNRISIMVAKGNTGKTLTPALVGYITIFADDEMMNALRQNEDAIVEYFRQLDFPKSKSISANDHFICLRSLVHDLFANFSYTDKVECCYSEYGPYEALRFLGSADKMPLNSISPGAPETGINDYQYTGGDTTGGYRIKIADDKLSISERPYDEVTTKIVTMPPETCLLTDNVLMFYDGNGERFLICEYLIYNVENEGALVGVLVGANFFRKGDLRMYFRNK